MAKSVNITASALIWCMERTPLALLPNQREYRKVQRDYVVGGRTLLLGGGILRDHIVCGVMDDYALCGQPVSSWGGGAEGADCRRCRRRAKRYSRDDNTNGDKA